MCIPPASTIIIHLLSCLIPVLNLIVLLVVQIDYMDDISFSNRRKNRGYTYLCAGSVICESLLRAPQYSTFACCLIPVLTLVVLLVMLDDIDDISLLCRGWASVFIVSPPGIHISLRVCVRGYTYHGDTHITVTPARVTPAWVHPGSCNGARISPRYEISQRYHVNTKRPPVSVWNRSVGRLERVAHA